MRENIGINLGGLPTLKSKLGFNCYKKYQLCVGRCVFSFENPLLL